MSLAHLTRWLGSDDAAREAEERKTLADLLTGARSLQTLGPPLSRDAHPGLREAAERHGVIGLLGAETPGWAAATRALQTRALRALRFTLRAVAVVEGAGIACVVLKGAAAGSRWTEPTARQQSDLDLLVGRADQKAASQVLIDSGLASHEFMPGEHMHNASLAPKEKSGLMIELHHALNSNHEIEVDVPALLARRIRVETAQGPLPALAMEDDAAYLAMHAATHAIGRLAWLVDLEGLGRAQVDWVEAARRAKAWNIALPVECAWREARELLAVPIPEQAFDALGTGLTQRSAISALYRATWATSGTAHLWLERAFRLALVPPGAWPLLAVHKVRARLEQDKAYGT